MHNKNSKGFTLIELLIVVSLIVITVGVSSDIIVSLVRSYNKTRVANEIEQNTNYVLLKLEKELRDADSVVVNSATQVTISRELNDTPVTISYTVDGNGNLFRAVNGGSQVTIINDDSVSGIRVDRSDGQPNFADISELSDGSIVKIHLVFIQRGSAAAAVFTGAVSLDNTVVVRGAY
ncbi:MAG: PilW family protein [Patescibacteria group bacterium]